MVSSPAPSATPPARRRSGEHDGDGWLRVARHVRNRRLELGLTQEAAAARGKVHPRSWARVESGASEGYRLPILVGVCRSLDWAPDSIERVLGGGQPLVRPRGRDQRPGGSARRLLRPLLARDEHGVLRLCPMRIAALAGMLIEAAVVAAFLAN
jgi:hypothetical protein